MPFGRVKWAPTGTAISLRTGYVSETDSNTSVISRPCMAWKAESTPAIYLNQFVSWFFFAPNIVTVIL